MIYQSTNPALKEDFHSLEELDSARTSLTLSPEGDLVLIPPLSPADYRELHEVRIIHDDDPPDLDYYASVIVCWHRRYNLGTVNLSSREGYNNYLETHAEEISRAKAAGLFFPIFMYEHTGISLNLGGMNPAWPDQRWDAGQVGFIYLDPIHASELGIPDPLACLKAEFDEWSAYCEGDYYYIYDLDDEEFLFSGRYSACEDFLSAHPEYKEVSSENE